MNVRLLMLAGATVICAAPAWADGPWYVSGSIGGYFREDRSFDTTFGHLDEPGVRVPGTNKQSFDPGVIGNLALGYQLAPRIRLEAEIGYFDYTGSTLNPLTHSRGFPRLNGSTYVQQSGDEFGRFTGTVNAFYDFLPIAGFTPYAGAGVGASADHQSSGLFVEPNGSQFTQGGGTSSQGLILVEAGASYPLTETLSITASYRYVHFFADNEDAAHIVKMGIRYSF